MQTGPGNSPRHLPLPVHPAVRRPGAAHRCWDGVHRSLEQREGLDVATHAFPLRAVPRRVLLPGRRTPAVPPGRILRRWQRRRGELHALSGWNVPTQNQPVVVSSRTDRIRRPGRRDEPAQRVPQGRRVRHHRVNRHLKSVPSRALLLGRHADVELYGFRYPGTAAAVSVRHLLRPWGDHQQNHREQLHHTADVFRGVHVRTRKRDAAGQRSVSIRTLLPSRGTDSLSVADVLSWRGEHRAEAVHSRPVPARTRPGVVQEVSSRDDLPGVRAGAPRTVSPGLRVRRGRTADSC
mmetsp:Transcript_8209/g.30709  ORF Transcript_8209/g.30709 Transcript_8209/m.30709 type:complete len:293 (+) Transcript_8209:1245-2123(+)